MKLAYVSCLYEGAIAACYRRDPGLAARDYRIQRDLFFAEGLHWNGAWEGALSPLGYEVFGFLSNVEPLQRAWAREAGLPEPGDDWRETVTLAQLRAANPEVLLLDGGKFSAPWLRAVRETCPALRLVLVLVGSPSYDLELVRASDGVLSCSRALVERIRHAGRPTRHFPHAFNSAMLQHLPARESVKEVILFSGGLVSGRSYHSAREDLVAHLVEQVPLELHTEKAAVSRRVDFAVTLARRGVYAAQQLLQAAGMPTDRRWRLPLIGRAAAWNEWPAFQFNARLHPHLRPALFGREMLAACRRSAVSLNVHGGVAAGYASNVRLFEATGTGSCLLTDRCLDLGDFFAEGDEVAAFGGQEECAEQARWLLDHPREREVIALRGQQRTLRDHTYAARTPLLHEIISTGLAHRHGS